MIEIENNAMNIVEKDFEQVQNLIRNGHLKSFSLDWLNVSKTAIYFKTIF